MSDLIEQARLTEKEIRYASIPIWSRQDIADAATAKALWAVVEWLSAQGSATHDLDKYQDRKWLAYDLQKELLAAGIERPKGVLT